MQTLELLTTQIDSMRPLLPFPGQAVVPGAFRPIMPKQTEYDFPPLLVL